MPVGSGGSPGEVGVGCGSLWGQAHRWQRHQGILTSVRSLEGRHFGTETRPQPKACRFQCWDTSGQTTSRWGAQPHPSMDRLPNVVLSSQPPLNTPLDTALPTRGKKMQLHPPVSRHQSLPPGSLHKPLDQPHPPWGRHQKQEDL